MMGVMVSPLHGADGNTEFLLHLRRAGTEEPVPSQVDVRALVDTAVDAAVARSEPAGAGS
jgi:hypothetical protein